MTSTPTPYSPGLEGIIAGETAISRVDPEAGLVYRGYDIADLAMHTSFEEVTWLLFHGELPSMRELGELSRSLAEERPLPSGIVDLLAVFPAGMHPMDSLRTGVSMLAGFDPELNNNSHEANLRKALRLVARVGSLISALWRTQRGLELLPPKSDLTHAGNFLYQIYGEVPEMWRTEIFDTVLVLYADHGFNASTFSARVTASTLADIYAAITTAVGTLKGPLHGGANEEAMKMLKDIGSPERAEAWLRPKLEKKEKIMGFGHRVYKTGDSRVPIMRELARQLGRRTGQERWVEICQTLEEVMEGEKNLYANVDLYSAPVLALLDIPSVLNTPIFACARVAGWCAHVIEQYEHNRLIRPRSLYTGPQRRQYNTGAKRSAA